jgi:ATP-dependent DNA ligase
MSFPTLHGYAANGKIKVWTIEVIEQSTIRTTRGFLNGKLQVNDKVIESGKNIGKKNETSPYQQAMAESQSAWVKMKESGYFEPNSSNTMPNNVIPFPMLAHEYSKRSKSSVFPCYVQPKLDGVRAIGIEGRLYSRNRKAFPHLKHITDELPLGIQLDGELYTDTMSFQEIVGLVKKEKLPEHNRQCEIKYYVYDIICDKPYEQRYQDLTLLFKTNSFKHLRFVKTEMCSSESHMKAKHDQFVSNGFEGIMIRNPMGKYKNARSVDLLKYKEFMDDEYTVIGFTEGDGLEKGCVIWICQTEEGKQFHCRPRGTHADRMELFQHGNEYIGKKLTVRYQELTSSEEKVPRFPVGLSFRDYE